MRHEPRDSHEVAALLRALATGRTARVRLHGARAPTDVFVDGVSFGPGQPLAFNVLLPAPPTNPGIADLIPWLYEPKEEA